MAGNEYRTNSRTKIMEYLLANRDHAVSVREIDLHMKAENYPVNLTTIYRYLDKLERDGCLIRYVGEGDKATYQYADRERRCAEHLHLKCTECGAVFHLDCAFMDEISSHIREHHGFFLQCRNSVLYGLCEACRKKKISKNSD